MIWFIKIINSWTLRTIISFIYIYIYIYIYNDKSLIFLNIENTYFIMAPSIKYIICMEWSAHAWSIKLPQSKYRLFVHQKRVEYFFFYHLQIQYTCKWIQIIILSLCFIYIIIIQVILRSSRQTLESY